jgi:ABC-2 type transport system permease protein
MTTTTPERIEMVPATATGWRLGFANLLRKELGVWSGSALWWIQTLIWLLMLDFTTAMTIRDTGGRTRDALLSEATLTFFQVAAVAIPIGIVITLMGAIVGEKDLGTAAWVLSKPVSRTAFVLSKFVAHLIGFLTTAVIVPAAVFLLMTRLMLSEWVDPGRFATGLGVLCLSLLFYIALALALGTLARSQGLVAGVGITFILLGQVFKGMLPEPVVILTPWPIGDAAASFASNGQPGFGSTVLLAAVTAEVLVLAAVALWRFAREEF